MAKCEEVLVDGINHHKRLVVVEGGVILPIVEYRDSDGDVCDYEDAVSCIAGTDEFGWLNIDINDYEPLTVH